MFATLILNGLVAAAGVALIVGACLRWRWLVDPPIAVVPQMWLKRFFGVTACVVFVCALGSAIVALAIWGSWAACCR